MSKPAICKKMNNKMRLVLYRDKFIQQFKFNEKVYSSLEKKEKKQTKSICSLQFLQISDNYIVTLKKAPNRHTDHASEWETFEGTRSIYPTRHTRIHAHTRTHTLIIHPRPPDPPVHSDIGLFCKH